jgi:hypothetical protein
VTVAFHPSFREQALFRAFFTISSACLRVFTGKYRVLESAAALPVPEISAAAQSNGINFMIALPF